MKGAPRSGLDDGLDKSKKRKAEAAAPARPELKINPGESLREFGRRVDVAIPVHFPKGDGAARERRKKKAKKEAVAEYDSNVEPSDGEEIHSDDDDEHKDQQRQARENFEMAKRRKGRKRGDSPDPWAVLEKKRGNVSFGGTAPPPPTLKKPRALLYIAGSKSTVDVDSVPKSAGSLAKREGLAGERRSIVEAYRKLMSERRVAEKNIEA